MRPTKGEIRNTPASAQATAWAKENSSVRLQWMPARSSCSAARMPSQVEAILISRRSRPMPSASYRSTSLCACASVASVSKLSRASTSVETRPGISLRISRPTATASRSPASATRLGRSPPRALAMAASISGAYAGSEVALSSSEGLVVASRGWNRAMASMSPVSATTAERARSCSSWLVMGGYRWVWPHSSHWRNRVVEGRVVERPRHVEKTASVEKAAFVERPRHVRMPVAALGSAGPAARTPA